LPSGRVITYPEARLIPSKFEDAPSDVEFQDNARGQWKAYRGWFGTFVENVVQGTARDLLAAAIDRFEARGIRVVFHCHDEVTVESPIGALTDAEFLEILLELPDWAAGLPLGGKVHSGSHYLAPPEEPAQAMPNSDTITVDQAIDDYLEPARAEPELEPELEFGAKLEPVDDGIDAIAPLAALVSLPMSSGNMVCCPFHDDTKPSCAIYADRFRCYGCGEHGSRLDWLMRAEGMTEAEAAACIAEGPAEPVAIQAPRDDAETLAFIERIWTDAQPLAGSIAERYLDQTRGIDLDNLPADVGATLRFHPRCVFGPGTYLPCLLALMRDPLTDAVTGIQRIV
jgi:hypothetical protein